VTYRFNTGREMPVPFFLQLRGCGVGGGPRRVSMAKWARFCICNRQEMAGSSEQGRALLGPCMTRTLARWYDPDPLGGLCPARCQIWPSFWAPWVLLLAG
jgi:hypothetical protein